MRLRTTLASFATACLLLAGAGHAAEPATAWKRGIENQRQADLGNGTFLNPVFAGDRPDPSVLKDGEVADDKFLSGVNFYIQGVEGKVPSGK